MGITGPADSPTLGRMDAVFAYWQSLGVDGFRCDMSHMVPPEFWAGPFPAARQRQAGRLLPPTEAYNDDPAKVPGPDPRISQRNWATAT